MKTLSFIFSGLLLTMAAAAPVLSADCPALVQQALAATDSLCGETGKNEACYGNINLTAKPNTPTLGDFRFSQPGDRVNVSDIKSLRLSPMQIETGEWGVALMNINANLPSSSTAGVTLLAFGDVTLENNVPTPTTIGVSVPGSQNVNVRLLPNTNAGVVGTLKPNQTITALEQIADGSWVRVKLPDSDLTGWVSSDLIQADGNLRMLNIVEASQAYYQPMQAFTFTNGSRTGEPVCAEMPEDGLIIQTPEGEGEVQLWINQVVVKMGSTVYFQAQPSGDMVVRTLEGHATVEALGGRYTAVAGTQVTVPLDANLNPVGGPTLPVAYDAAVVGNLPIEHLQRKITPHAPLSADEVTKVQKDQTVIDCLVVVCDPSDANIPGNGGNNGNSGNGSSNSSDNCPGKSCENGNKDDCPGNSCNAGSNGNQGNKDDCPGKSCENGNKDDCPGNSCNAGSNGNGNSGSGNNGNGNGNSGSNNGNGNGDDDDG